MSKVMSAANPFSLLLFYIRLFSELAGLSSSQFKSIGFFREFFSSLFSLT